MVRRALTRQTRWYQICCSIFKIKDFIAEKPFWKILEFWPLETPILTWAKKWPKWFRNVFSRAFERCLSFFPTATRSRDHGEAFKRPPPPPPPAGGGKSKGPAGRGLSASGAFWWGAFDCRLARLSTTNGSWDSRGVRDKLPPPSPGTQGCASSPGVDGFTWRRSNGSYF